MIWLTWRQFRGQAVVAAAALVVVAAVLAISGPGLAHLYHTSASVHAFLIQVSHDTAYTTLYMLEIGVMFVAPALIGVFWGAPLITREIEAGTYRLVWNQSVTRTRWAAVKVGLLGLASMATAGLFSLMVTWWASPIDRAAGAGPGSGAGVVSLNRLAPVLFAARGIAPIGYAAFAFALGVTVGVLIRRTIPAMAITLAVFAFVQVAMPMWIRPHLLPPVRATAAFNPGNITALMQSASPGPGGSGGGSITVLDSANIPGAWILSNQTVNSGGHVFTGPAPAACQDDNGLKMCAAALGRLHLRQVVTYQPASHYWPLQWYEMAIFLGVAVALGGLSFWWIRRRFT